MHKVKDIKTEIAAKKYSGSILRKNGDSSGTQRKGNVLVGSR
jgi:hypothetical protein